MVRSAAVYLPTVRELPVRGGRGGRKVAGGSDCGCGVVVVVEVGGYGGRSGRDGGVYDSD